MDKVARLPAEDRAALFGETGAGRGVANTIIEKDFWVCWTLKRLFSLQRQEAAALVFKGGTSLSKAFGAIRRFSEDIDLSFDRADLGYTGDRDPETEGISRKQANQLIKDLVDDVEHHIAEKLLPALRAVIVTQLGEPNQGQWSLEIDANDAQTVNFHYPTALPAPRIFRHGLHHAAGKARTWRARRSLANRTAGNSSLRGGRLSRLLRRGRLYRHGPIGTTYLLGESHSTACGGTSPSGVADTTVLFATLL